MKKFYLFLITAYVFSVCNLHAQMDEKFYHPDKEWIGVDFKNYKEIIHYSEEDTVYSLLIKPEKDVKATVLYFHGNGGNISKWANYIRPLIDDGFQVFIMDYRGYGLSTGKPTHLNIAEDAQILFDKLLKNENIKNTPIIIYGASIGSQIATHLARNNNSKVTALVLDGAMTSFTDIALQTSPEEMHDNIRLYVTSPYSAKEDITYLKNISVLFIHSEQDFIPIAGAKKMYDSVECKKTFWVYDGKHIEAVLLYPETFLKYMNELLY